MLFHAPHRAAIVGGLFAALAVSSLAEEPQAKRFAALDANGDKKLTLDEFLKAADKPAVLKRDFQLFDQDGDKALSPEEFDDILLGRPANQRGGMADPLVVLLHRAQRQLDENFDNWDKNPGQRVLVNDFVQSFIQSFPDPNRVTNNFDQLRRDADEDKNGVVHRAEAHRFLELQLGMRYNDGTLLRLPNGQVIRNGGIYSQLDSNQDRVIDRAEFLAFWPQRDKLDDEQWKRLDTDQDGRLDLGEYSRSEVSGVEDPIEQFRAWDTDLDAHLSEQELLAGTPEEWQPLARHAFPGFDGDGNEKLTLWEFRQLPQANPVLPWTMSMKDADRNGVLQFHEFTFGDGRCPLLRMIYFLRFDVDGSGFLEPKEFPFSLRPPQALYRLNADGTGWKKIFSSDDYPVIGSPKISADGKWLVCDAKPRGVTNIRGGKLLLMTADGQNVRDLGSGVLPTWSPDGKKIAYSDIQNNVHLMDLESKETRLLAPNVWCAQWSPDGKSIAVAVGGVLKTIDVETKKATDILTEAETPYGRVFWNMAWSPDNRRIAFYGARKNGDAELASVNVDNPADLKVHYAGKRPFSNNLSWSPDGKRIVFGMHAENSTRLLLHEVNPDQDGEPVRMKGQNVALQLDDPCWSPDGAYLIVQGREDDE